MCDIPKQFLAFRRYKIIYPYCGASVFILCVSLCFARHHLLRIPAYIVIRSCSFSLLFFFRSRMLVFLISVPCIFSVRYCFDHIASVRLRVCLSYCGHYMPTVSLHTTKKRRLCFVRFCSSLDTVHSPFVLSNVRLGVLIIPCSVFFWSNAHTNVMFSWFVFATVSSVQQVMMCKSIF